jgi:protein-L-isoaspartate(D-aspartate) O-methyltransferase
MVEDQLMARGIRDRRVIAALLKIPRHRFVDEGLWPRAYGDHALPIGFGQTISQPYMVALMTECLELTGSEKVLEVGTGSGYQAAVLAETAERVFTVERIAALGTRARDTLDSLGYQNVVIRVADGSVGWKEFAPFDRIVVTAGSPDVPRSLVEQLTEDGLLAIPIGDRSGQRLVRARRAGDGFESEEICLCAFVPLVGREGWADAEKPAAPAGDT